MNTTLVIFLLLIIFFVYRNFLSKLEDLNDEVKLLKNKISALENKNQRSEPQEIDVEKTEISPGKIINKNPETVSTKIEWPEPFVNPSKKPSLLDLGLEFVRQNLLSILGIFTLVLGVGYFVKYAIDKNWIGPLMRVLIGIFAGISVIFTGFFLRKTYAVFSSILVGGGFAILYFTVTLAFQENMVFTQNSAFVGLFLITVFAVAAAFYLRSEALILLAIIGGFAAPLMVSNGQNQPLFLFSYLLILNLGMLVVSYRKNWTSLGYLCFVFTTLYFGFWVTDQPNQWSILFCIVFYLIFYVFALRLFWVKNEFRISDAALLVLVNLAYVPMMWQIFNQLQWQPKSLGILILLLPNVAVLVYHVLKKNFGFSYAVFVGLSATLLALMLCLMVQTAFIPTFWAIESVLLLGLFYRTNHQIFLKSFSVLYFFSLLSLVIVWGLKDLLPKPDFSFHQEFITGLAVGFCSLTAYFLAKKIALTHWQKILFHCTAAVFYLTFFIEIYSQLAEITVVKKSVLLLLYTLYFVFMFSLIQKREKTMQQDRQIFTLVLLLVVAVLVLNPALNEAFINKEISWRFYGFYLLYLIPVLFVLRTIFGHISTVAKHEIWLGVAVFVLMISAEFCHVYLLSKDGNADKMRDFQVYFSRLYLSIIWMLIGLLILYFGTRKKTQELVKIGFTLIGITVAKLYLFDVWKMNQISRIIAFTVLGLLLLGGSFLFQKLKNLVKNLVDDHDNGSEPN